MGRDDYPREPVVAPTDVRRQHYVSQFYLRHFADPSGRIRATDLSGSGQTFVTGTANVALEVGFYDFDVAGQTVSTEDWLATLEGAANLVITRLVDDPASLGAMSDADEEALARFLAAFRFRTPAFRDYLKTTQDQLVARIRSMGRSWLFNTHPRDEAEMIWEGWEQQPDEWWLSNARRGPPAESTAWMLSGVQGFANLLRSMAWRIGSVPAGRPLYTTDNPLASHMRPVRPWWETGGFTSFDYYVPLSPTVLLKLNRWVGAPAEGANGSRERRDFDLWEAEFAAKVLSARARRYAYGDARVVPREEAAQWLAECERRTVTWAIMVLGHDPRQPDLGRRVTRDERRTFGRVILERPWLFRLAADYIEPGGPGGAEWVQALLDVAASPPLRGSL
jgi:hypothetical protein